MWRWAGRVCACVWGERGDAVDMWRLLLLLHLVTVPALPTLPCCVIRLVSACLAPPPARLSRRHRHRLLAPSCRCCCCCCCWPVHMSPSQINTTSRVAIPIQNRLALRALNNLGAAHVLDGRKTTSARLTCVVLLHVMEVDAWLPLHVCLEAGVEQCVTQLSE